MPQHTAQPVHLRLAVGDRHSIADPFRLHCTQAKIPCAFCGLCAYGMPGLAGARPSAVVVVVVVPCDQADWGSQRPACGTRYMIYALL